MESSEDDAGTATNASRRTPAREKDVGLAEDVNATSSFYQKSSETRMSCQTTGMSEDNFDGDSVPSPSSQDVNTSTEAILDMIDEIVDGPGAPKRLQQASEVVDALNEEFATTSYNLNIIQEVTNSDCENLQSLPEEATPPISVCSEVAVSVATNTTSACSSQNDVPANTYTSTCESNDNVVPDPVPNVDDSVPSSCSLPNLPSSSEEQSVQDTCGSVCESQDRTNKCVTSSDNRDSVTVESAESTSCDNSVSESKVLRVEPKSWSPLRKRLVRPVLSDRRPDYTVSSTVDSQTVNTHATVHTCSENITKDVTSSSDAVPIVHGNVKPEEIRIVSEINFCQAETSVSPPKKIKLIRQKNVTGSCNKEVALDQASVLAAKEPCQSTSHDNHSVNLSIPIVEPLKTENMSNLQDSSDIKIDNNYVYENLPEPPVESGHSVSPTEHSLPNIELQKCSDRDNSNNSSNVDQLHHIEPINTSESLSTNICTPNVEQASSGCHADSSPKQIINKAMNYLEQGKMCNTYDSENRELDYIPLCLPPINDACQSTTKELGLQAKDPTSHVPEFDAKINPPKISDEKSGSIECESKHLKHELQSFDVGSKSSTLELKSTELESKITEFEPKHEKLGKTSNKIDSNLGDNNTINTKVELTSCETLSTNVESVPTNSRDESMTSEIQLENSNAQIKRKELQSTSLEFDSVASGPDSNKSNSNEHREPKNCEIAFKSSELVSGNTSEVANAPVEPRNVEIRSSNSGCQIPVNCEYTDNVDETQQEDKKKVPPIKLNLTRSSVSRQPEPIVETEHSRVIKNNVTLEDLDSIKQVPKLTIKLKPPDEPKSPVHKVTIKPLRHLVELNEDDKIDNTQQIKSVTKLNIKPIVKPVENLNDKQTTLESESDKKDECKYNKDKESTTVQLPLVKKLNIKRVQKPAEKINDIHRKSSSSEISESEYSENDDTTSTSDQTSASDNGSSDIIPKVTIKLGKPGTESEGKFYTEKNVPKLTIKGIQQDEKVIISQSEDTQHDKVPKLTIKTVTKIDSQPLSPKLTIKPMKPPDSPNKEGEIPKMKISSDSLSTSECKESLHVPKITIKAVTRTDYESRTPKKSLAMFESPEHIPVVTKLNIKPILKPGTGESSEDFDDKVPVVSKLNIKPIIKPKDNDVNSSIDEVPKITKLNIKPVKNPEENSTEHFKDCDDLSENIDKNNIPVVTKINIKPIVKPQEEKQEKDSENLSSETGNSSDENVDNIPIVTKLNIKPIVKPDNSQDISKSVMSNEQGIPVVTKLNIKPLVKPVESSPVSPKKEHAKGDVHSTSIPVVTKINIKPIIRPEEAEASKSKDNSEEKSTKNPPLLMKINMKSVTDNINHECSDVENVSNYVSDGGSLAQKISKVPHEMEKTTEKKGHKCVEMETENAHFDSSNTSHCPVEILKQNCVPNPIKSEDHDRQSSVNRKIQLNTTKSKGDTSAVQHSVKQTNVSVTRCDSIQSRSIRDLNAMKQEKAIVLREEHKGQEHENTKCRSVDLIEDNVKLSLQQKASAVQNCTLLKKLLENTKDSLDKKLDIGKVVNCALPSDRSESTLSSCNNIVNSEHLVESMKSGADKIISKSLENKLEGKISSEKVNDLNISESSTSLHELREKVNESVTKPLEITISDKITNQGSGQDSPRIILKINKTDHGSSAKIITDDIKRTDTLHNYMENNQDNLKDKQSPRKHVANSRRKQTSDTAIEPFNLSTGKRLRSSRIVENTEKTLLKKNTGKGTPPPLNSPPQNKESELSTLQTKRLKLEQLLSESNAVAISSVPPLQTSPTQIIELKSMESKPVVKTVNHSLLNSENCSKNGNSKLHNILSNLQAKQMQSLGLINANCSDKGPSVSSDTECNASLSSSDLGDVPHMENSHPKVQQMIINENSDFRDLPVPEDISRDPLECLKPAEVVPDVVDIPIPKPVELTPQPRKRGRPRKLPVSEGAKPAAVTLPVPALEERPQRSLRLMRDRPPVLQKPRGRGRGRGARRLAEGTPPVVEPKPFSIIQLEQPDERPAGEIDPMSSRIKLPRMTEALDKMPCAMPMCMTPLSSRHRNSLEDFSMGETSELRTILDSNPSDDFPNTPELSGPIRRGRGRGSRGGRGRTPRGRGRGRGGGRGAMYMKETMGIYGRVCGPATTTVQLFEEETCMMDDNATPASSRPSHLLDDDSQSSVKSSTNDSNKMKKSKFADLFDSNKVWTAADVKEYTWPAPDKPDVEHTVMMIQEQVAMFLGVKSFKRRYPELKRRTISGEERDYVLSKGVVTEALCDLGITAVDASDVLDIMLSDYPHKYEEFRSHQRQRQLAEDSEEIVEELKHEEKVKVEVKQEKMLEQKPELPKIDPEKTRQDMAAAAIASASEWNARANAARRSACADLQSLTVLRPRAPPAPPRLHHAPPAGLYPHALLPGQYQHSYRLYTPEQLRYFPLNTVLAAPPPPPSVTEWSSDSEPDWGSRCSSSDDSDGPAHQSAKRKKLSKVKRVSQVEAPLNIKEESREATAEAVDTCRVCKLRLEANRKYTHERFLVCANCNAKLHPACIELNADTIRKCREYPWQCAECKTCCSCRQPADDDKMLFCDLCDRGFHIYCVGLDTVPSGRWHCVECAVCKSCGARAPGGAGGEWHHQTRRGPGGHKLYSHSLCTPCARAYRIGRYCPLCERSFIGPKGTMQLVICKLCDRQLHQECVKQSGAGSTLRVMDYTCADCRRGGITSRAAAVRLAPRTIATLFMAKRRFNKYAHRQYMESRLRAGAPDPPDLSADMLADTPDVSVDTPDLSGDAPDHSGDLSADAP